MMSKLGIREKIQERNGKKFYISFYDFWWKPPLNRIHLIRDIQISRQMTMYGQTLGVFKRENNEYSRNGEKTILHKDKIVVFSV